MAKSNGEKEGTNYGSVNSSTRSSCSNVAKEGESIPLVSGNKTSNEIGGIPVYESASWVSQLVFGWMAPLLAKGNTKVQLDPSDLKDLPLPHSCTTEHICDAFDHYWEEEMKIAKNTDKDKKKKKKKKWWQRKQKESKALPSLSWCLIKAYYADFARAGVLKLFHDLLIFVGPQVLNAIIDFLGTKDAPLSYGLKLTALVTTSQLLMSLCLRHYFFRCYVTALRVRTAIVVAVYRKALKLSASERETRTTGEITNLISVDAQRLQDLITYLHAIWYSFLQIGLALFFLWGQLGVSSLAACAVIIFMMPITKSVSRWMGRKQKALMKAKDQRVEINNEVLGSMKVIKFQAWEQPFQAKIEHLRAFELRKLYDYFIANACSIMLWSSVPLLVSLSTFGAYILLGNTLHVAEALTALSLFEILRFPLFMLPTVINNIVEASISLRRVQSFLLCKEHQQIEPGPLQTPGIQMTNASFVYDSKRPQTEDMSDTQWQIILLKSQLQDAENRIRELKKDNFNHDTLSDPSSPSSQNLLSLKRVNFECNPGELIAVVGAVGAGKSTFLNSILGEVQALAGTVHAKGSVAYFAQTPFILNDTVQANVIFGKQQQPFDKSKYKKALSVCALKHDLKMLPGGDQCEIGEKGITLSGGQKARIAMARAVYQDADLYLLDDPLAAVDAHVGRHIFQKCIVEKLLSKKMDGSQSSVILTTNALQYLSNPMVDRILVLNQGKLQEQGTYEELTNDKTSLFHSFLKSFNDTLSDQAIETPEIPHHELVASPSDSSLNALGDVSEFPEVANVLSPNATVGTLRRASSIKRTVSEDEQENGDESGNLMTDEFQERVVGHVSSRVYLEWTRAAGGVYKGVLIIAAFGFVEGINVISRWWLTYWGLNGTDETQLKYLAVYAAINVSVILATFCRLLLLLTCGLTASKKLFSRVLDTVLKAPMSFFDTTPIGRIVNRFSKDFYTVDEQLIATLRSYLSTISNVASAVIVVCSASPLFIACLVPIFGYYTMQSRFFTKSYRELKRLDSVSRSPLYALLGETLDGISTIRAYSAQSSLANKLTNILNIQQNAYFLTVSAQCWLAVRIELVGTIIIMSACLLSVSMHRTRGGDEGFAGLAGLSVSYALSITQSLNWTVRMNSDFEANMIAVERVEQYSILPSEADRTTEQDETVDSKWPMRGEIVFKNVKLRYRSNLPLVLKGLDLVIPAQSKVGVVGRTGAGKSTLMVALLRIVELDTGNILIDDVDIGTIGLSLLRSKIAVIPQDPCLFTGTVKSNLDPFSEYSDERLYEVLRRVGLFTGDNNTTSTSSTSLSSMVHGAVSTLDDLVFEGGSNFSVGQRQLIVIARALLRESRIVIMDEATASVDAETDGRIQRVMRTEFKNATCISVAHRLNTIMDSSYILVMDNGKAAEFNTPSNLLAKGGLFKDLVDTWEEEHGTEK